MLFLLFFTFFSVVTTFITDSVPKGIYSSAVGSSAAFKRLFAIDFHIHAL